MQEAPLRSRQSVTIDAPVEAVWEYNADLARIAEFHPRVEKVELIDGQSHRARASATSATSAADGIPVSSGTLRWFPWNAS
jgi:uncharacterized membrane protein